MQFIYQDTLKPPDEFDQIMFNVKNTYDQYLFNLSSKSSEFDSYRDLETEAYEFSTEKTQWSVRATISFFQPIKLTYALFDAFLDHLTQQNQFQIVTKLNSQGTTSFSNFSWLFGNDYIFFKEFKQNTFVSYFAEIYPSKIQANKQINDECTLDVDCIDPNSQCVSTCNNLNCPNSPRVCRCNAGYFESLNIFDNTIKCSLIEFYHFTILGFLQTYKNGLIKFLIKLFHPKRLVRNFQAHVTRPMFVVRTCDVRFKELVNVRTGLPSLELLAVINLQDFLTLLNHYLRMLSSFSFVNCDCA